MGSGALAGGQNPNGTQMQSMNTQPQMLKQMGSNQGINSLGNAGRVAPTQMQSMNMQPQTAGNPWDLPFMGQQQWYDQLGPSAPWLQAGQFNTPYWGGQQPTTDGTTTGPVTGGNTGVVPPGGGLLGGGPSSPGPSPLPPTPPIMPTPNPTPVTPPMVPKPTAGGNNNGGVNPGPSPTVVNPPMVPKPSIGGNNNGGRNNNGRNGRTGGNNNGGLNPGPMNSPFSGRDGDRTAVVDNGRNGGKGKNGRKQWSAYQLQSMMFDRGRR